VTGQDLRTLKAHAGEVKSLAFSADGQLTSAAADGTIRVWDARPWTPELRRQREALGLVEYLCQRLPSKEKMIERIGADKGITEEVRKEAVALLDAYWPGHLRRQLADCLAAKKWGPALRYADQLLALDLKEGNLHMTRNRLLALGQRQGVIQNWLVLGPL